MAPACRHQRLHELHVHVHRSLTHDHRGQVVGGDHVERGCRLAEEAHLVGGLVGTGAPHRRRPVGGDHDQRYAGVGGLQHGRVEVRGGCARRAEDDGGPVAALGQAEREEAGGALVDPRVQRDPARLGGVVRRERQWCAPRAGAQDQVLDTRGHQQVDQVAGQLGGGHRASASTARRRASQCATRSGAAASRSSASGEGIGRATGSTPSTGSSGMSITSSASSCTVARPQA